MKFARYKTLYIGKRFNVSVCIDCNDLYLLPTIDIAFQEKYLEFAWLVFGFGIIKQLK